MRKRHAAWMAAAALVGVLSAGQAAQATTLGSYTFEDNAFADVVLGYGGNWQLVGAPDIQTAVVGNNVSDYIWTFDGNAWADIGFTDNRLRNGSGNDLAVFEISGYGWPGATGCTVRLTINGVTQTRTPVWDFSNVYVALFDLDQFGVPAGGLVSSFTARGVSGGDPEYAAFGALNNAAVPLPASIWLLGAGCAGLAGLARRRDR
ncbi:MAG: VPLPA-CTERM sorting domain-containing protein [Thermodesulfobacteriota bacterium]